MKQVKVIWLVALIVGALSYFYIIGSIRHEQDKVTVQTCPVWLSDTPQKGCSTVDEQAFCSDGLDPKADYCSGLEVGDNYGEQKTIDASQLVGDKVPVNASTHARTCMVLNNEGGCNEY